ncbi:MAG: hypothetical protein ACR65U_08395 [Methylocystis sp.]
MLVAAVSKRRPSLARIDRRGDLLAARDSVAISLARRVATLITKKANAPLIAQIHSSSGLFFASRASLPCSLRETDEIHFSLAINLRESAFIAEQPNVGGLGATHDFRRQVLWKKKCNVRIAR